MAKTKQTRKRKSTASSSLDDVSLVIRPKPVQESSSTCAITPEVSESIRRWRFNITRLAACEVKTWRAQMGPYVRTNKKMAKRLKKYTREEADRWLQELTNATAELATIHPQHNKTRCQSCLDGGPCQMATRLEDLFVARNKARQDLVMFEAVKLYTSPDETSAEPILSSSTSAQQRSSGSHSVQVSHTEGVYEQDLVDSEEEEAPQQRAGKNMNDRRTRDAPRRKAGYKKVKRSPSDVGESDDDYQDDSDTPSFNDLLAASLSQSAKSRRVSGTTTEAIASNAGRKNVTMTGPSTLTLGNSMLKSRTGKDGSSTIPIVAKNSKRHLCELESDESSIESSPRDMDSETNTISDVKSVALPGKRSGSRSAAADRQTTKILSQKRQPGESVEFAIKIEEDDEDSSCNLQDTSQTPFDGLGSLRKKELLHLVRQLKAEKATQANKAKIREWICKRKGVTPDMLTAFETKVSSKRKWHDAAEEVFGPEMNTEDSDAPLT